VVTRQFTWYRPSDNFADTIHHYAHSSHRRHRQDETVLSCLVGSVNIIGDKSRLSATKNFETVLSSLKIRWGLLKTVLTCRQFCSHHRQGQTRVLSCQCQRCQLDITVLLYIVPIELISAGPSDWVSVTSLVLTSVHFKEIFLASNRLPTKHNIDRKYLMRNKLVDVKTKAHMLIGNQTLKL